MLTMNFLPTRAIAEIDDYDWRNYRDTTRPDFRRPNITRLYKYLLPAGCSKRKEQLKRKGETYAGSIDHEYPD